MMLLHRNLVERSAVERWSGNLLHHHRPPRRGRVVERSPAQAICGGAEWPVEQPGIPTLIELDSDMPYVIMNDPQAKFAALAMAAKRLNAERDAATKARNNGSAMRTKAVAKPRPLAAAPAPVAYQSTDLSRALAAEWRRQQAARAERPAATELTDRQQRERSDAIWNRVLASRTKRP